MFTSKKKVKRDLGGDNGKITRNIPTYIKQTKRWYRSEKRRGIHNVGYTLEKLAALAGIHAHVVRAQNAEHAAQPNANIHTIDYLTAQPDDSDLYTAVLGALQEYIDSTLERQDEHLGSLATACQNYLEARKGFKWTSKGLYRYHWVKMVYSRAKICAANTRRFEESVKAREDEGRNPAKPKYPRKFYEAEDLQDEKLKDRVWQDWQDDRLYNEMNTMFDTHAFEEKVRREEEERLYDEMNTMFDTHAFEEEVRHVAANTRRFEESVKAREDEGRNPAKPKYPRKFYEAEDLQDEKLKDRVWQDWQDDRLYNEMNTMFDTHAFEEEVRHIAEGKRIFEESVAARAAEASNPAKPKYPRKFYEAEDLQDKKLEDHAAKDWQEYKEERERRLKAQLDEICQPTSYAGPPHKQENLCGKHREEITKIYQDAKEYLNYFKTVEFTCIGWHNDDIVAAIRENKDGIFDKIRQELLTNSDILNGIINQWTQRCDRYYHTPFGSNGFMWHMPEEGHRYVDDVQRYWERLIEYIVVPERLCDTICRFPRGFNDHIKEFLGMWEQQSTLGPFSTEEIKDEAVKVLNYYIRAYIEETIKKSSPDYEPDKKKWRDMTTAIRNIQFLRPKPPLAAEIEELDAYLSCEYYSGFEKCSFSKINEVATTLDELLDTAVNTPYKYINNTELVQEEQGEDYTAATKEITTRVRQLKNVEKFEKTYHKPVPKTKKDLLTKAFDVACDALNAINIMRHAAYAKRYKDDPNFEVVFDDVSQSYFVHIKPLDEAQEKAKKAEEKYNKAELGPYELYLEMVDAREAVEKAQQAKDKAQKEKDDIDAKVQNSLWFTDYPNKKAQISALDERIRPIKNQLANHEHIIANRLGGADNQDPVAAADIRDRLQAIDRLNEDLQPLEAERLNCTTYCERVERYEKFQEMTKAKADLTKAEAELKAANEKLKRIQRKTRSSCLDSERQQERSRLQTLVRENSSLKDERDDELRCSLSYYGFLAEAIDAILRGANPEEFPNWNELSAEKRREITEEKQAFDTAKAKYDDSEADLEAYEKSLELSEEALLAAQFESPAKEYICWNDLSAQERERLIAEVKSLTNAERENLIAVKGEAVEKRETQYLDKLSKRIEKIEGDVAGRIAKLEATKGWKDLSETEQQRVLSIRKIIAEKKKAHEEAQAELDRINVKYDLGEAAELDTAYEGTINVLAQIDTDLLYFDQRQEYNNICIEISKRKNIFAGAIQNIEDLLKTHDSDEIRDIGDRYQEAVTFLGDLDTSVASYLLQINAAQCNSDWDELERIRNEMRSFVEKARKLYELFSQQLVPFAGYVVQNCQEREIVKFASKFTPKTSGNNELDVWYNAQSFIAENEMLDDRYSLVGIVDRANHFIENCINDPMILASELDTEEITQMLKKHSEVLTQLNLQGISAGSVEITGLPVEPE